MDEREDCLLEDLVSVLRFDRSRKFDFSRLYFGFSSTLRRGDLLSPPKAPGNYKDPEVISKYIAQARDRQMEKAAGLPLVASLTGLAVLDASGELMALGRYGDKGVDEHGQIAMAFLKLLALQSLQQIGTVFDWGYCFDGPSLLRLAVCDAAALRPHAYAELALEHPIVGSQSLLVGNSFSLIDPYRVVAPADVRDHLDPQEFTRGVLGDEYDFEEMRVRFGDAAGDPLVIVADAVRKLAKVFCF